MAQARYNPAPDGFDARVAQSWTEEKLMILEAYLAAFAHACKSAGWYSLDLFAGPGLNWSETLDQPRASSPIIALETGEPQAIKVVAAEKHGGAFEALQKRTEKYGNRITLFNDDANHIIGEMLTPIPVAAPTFAFLDPEGSELDWQTVDAIADHKRGHSQTKIEQLVLLPTDTGFIRLIEGHPDMVTRMFGHDRWYDIYERRSAGMITADEARSEYVKLYAQGLRDLGYRTVLDRQIKQANGKPMYFLIFATDHDAGERIMDHCFDHVKIRVHEELGQIPMFDMKDAPRRKRLGDD
jgi:three-Cys-motif partner protein